MLHMVPGSRHIPIFLSFLSSTSLLRKNEDEGGNGRIREREQKKGITEGSGQESSNSEDKRKHIQYEIRLLGRIQLFTAFCVIPEANMKGKIIS